MNMSTYTGDMIRKYRTEKGLTQKKLGEMCGIADSAIRRYEIGKANPKVETLQKIADALNISINRLLAGKIVISVNGAEQSKNEREQEEKDLAFLNMMDALGEELNDRGKDKAIEQVELLTKIPEYRKDN